jgi:FkbM family methyltransferase
MSNNLLAWNTLSYIWSHPNCKSQRIPSISRFIGWQFYKRLTHRTVELQLLSNVKMRCQPDSRSAASVLYCGLYDYDEMNFLLRYLRDEDSFLDIGANVGVYTLLAASKIRSGWIYSFEALPKNYQRLQENLKLNELEQVQTYAFAISNSIGSIDLSLSDGDSTPSIIKSEEDRNVTTVSSNTLDNLLDNCPLKLTLAKMDIEGAELLALKGATSLLEKKCPQVWIMEILGTGSTKLVNFLNSYGYNLYQYSADTNKISPISLEQKRGNNVLAIANTAIDFVRDRLVRA